MTSHIFLTFYFTNWAPTKKKILNNEYTSFDYQLMLDELPIEIWKKISGYLDSDDILNLMKTSKRMEFLKSDIIWKDIVKQNWFLTFYDFQSLTYNDSQEYEKIGSYYQLFRKLKFDDHHVIKVIDYMFDLNESKLNSVQLKLEGIYKNFRYYLPQLMREVRHLKPDDYNEINGRLAITRKQFDSYIKERSTNLRRIYIASKIIESFNLKKFYEFLKTFEIMTDNERPKDYETFYLQFSLCDPLFYDSLLIRHKIINETINEYNSIDFETNDGSNVKKVFKISEILMTQLEKQSGIILNYIEDGDTPEDVWLLSRLYMGDYEYPYPLLFLTIKKICSLVGLDQYVSLYFNYILIGNDNKTIYKFFKKEDELTVKFLQTNGNDNNFNNYENSSSDCILSGENGDVYEYESIFISSAWMEYGRRYKVYQIRDSQRHGHMINQIMCNSSSQLSFIGNNINSKMFYSILEFVYENKLGHNFITFYNRCLFMDEMKKSSDEKLFSLNELFRKETTNRMIEELKKDHFYEVDDKSTIGKFIDSRGSHGAIINVMRSNDDKIWYFIYSSNFGEELIREEHVDKDELLYIKPFVNALLCDDKIGKYFKSFDNGKFEAL